MLLRNDHGVLWYLVLPSIDLLIFLQFSKFVDEASPDKPA